MEDGWIKIRSFEKTFLAERAKEILIENNIEAVTINKKDSAYNMFGEIELYCTKEHKEQALELIKEV